MKCRKHLHYFQKKNIILTQILCTFDKSFTWQFLSNSLLYASRCYFSSSSVSDPDSKFFIILNRSIMLEYFVLCIKITLVYSFLIYWNILKIEDLVYFPDYEDWNYTLPTYCFYWNIYKIGKMVHSLFLQDIGIWKIVINQLIIDNINSHEDDGQPLGYLILGELRSNEPS